MTDSSDLGRPLSTKLSPNDAEVIRCAVRTATSYFGMPIGRLDGGASWVDAAMRGKSTMTATVAERLFGLVQRPEISLIGKKRPQGPSLAETQLAIDLHTADPQGCPLYQTPTLEYLNLIFAAARTVERYARAFPGSVLFVLPGSAQAVAESLADEINDAQILGQIGRSRRRKLVKFLSFYFELAERPLKTEKGESILGTLNALGIDYNAQTAARINEALPNERVSDPIPGLVALVEAEDQREKVLLTKASKKEARGKRRVTLRRNVDALYKDAPGPL